MLSIKSVVCGKLSFPHRFAKSWELYQYLIRQVFYFFVYVSLFEKNEKLKLVITDVHISYNLSISTMFTHFLVKYILSISERLVLYQ